MKEQLIEWLEISGPWAFIISLAANTLISLLAFVPSVFVTAANLSFFGFAEGLLLSFSGEMIGVMVSFYVYRKGFSFLKKKKMPKNIMLQNLSKTKGRDAFMLILALRIFPFAPSGAVTLAAAYSKVGSGIFFSASLIGKIPAILIEGFAVHQVLKADWHIQLFMGIGSILILVIFWMHKRRKNKKLQE
ncbi:TVP38/TMEM64 family protein [Peribacillus frigoritolerans]|uniref:TVP38/TMEM64 family protein n=1 Tax=Peribacillus frigoritolerans TaxID=450367 RepID=UPI00105A665F|nr:VTT domain-containing protein [Peribacillus frigoritolerans]TDL78637.1 TVP38/TMEM64 family protein [Peribacillus frigoritolerans]